MTTDERFQNIEMALTEQQRMLDDLSDVMLAHQREIDILKKENTIRTIIFTTGILFLISGAAQK